MFFIKKYIGYIEKFTTLKNINVSLPSASPIMERILVNCGFNKMSANRYTINRASQVTKVVQFAPFFTSEFSTISFKH